jgi:hypothetical protein
MYLAEARVNRLLIAGRHLLNYEYEIIFVLLR